LHKLVDNYKMQHYCDNFSMSISESQILAMPESAYMNADQLAFFKALLLQNQQQIEANFSSTSEHLREVEDAADPADRATQEEVRGLELRTRDRERKHLKAIRSALQRIEDGVYGYCEETGEPIGVARLIARPTTKLCIEAQERHERRERQFNS
jgi:DnaK suppressor protein